MNRRGFLGRFGAATAAAFVPFVVPESMTAATTLPARLPVPMLSPPKGAKVWMFGSIYSNLRVQITPKRAVQFLHGRYWTTDAKEADAVRTALSKAVAGIHHGGRDDSKAGGRGTGSCGWELKTKEDVELLSAAYKGRN